MQQGSDEWRAARLGKLTASRFHEAVARTQKGWGASRGTYMWDLITERQTGEEKKDRYISPSMRFGIENEHRARAAYSFYHAPVTEVGFVDHPTIPNAGASPDGFVGDDGMVEFKVPDGGTHGRALLGEPISLAYRLQMLWQLACCPTRKWVHYVSFNPRVAERISMKVLIVHRDQEAIKAMEDEARQFLKELDEKLAALRDLPDQRLTVAVA